MLGNAPKRPKVDGNGWLLTYGDMVTLLMAFFVMLFAISNVEQVKFEAFISGLSDFNNPNASTTDVTPIGEPVPPPSEQLLPPVMPGSPAPGTRALAAEFAATLAAAGLDGQVEVQVDRRGLVLIVGTDDVMFHSGSSVLTEQGRGIVAALGPQLAALPNGLVVEGHTDDVPLNRNGYTNWNLSTDRAVAVVNDLTGRHSIDPRRLEATGFGEWEPRDTSGTSAGRARNRRVEVVILAADESEAGSVRGAITDPVGGSGITDPVGVGSLIPPIAP